MSASNETNETDEPDKITLATYLVLNLIFWAFCLAQYLAARFYLGRIEGIAFFFVALGAGFTIVCLFDYLCGILGGGEKPEKQERGR